MTKPFAFKQAALTKALRGAVAAGFKVSGCRIDPVTGEIGLQFGNDNTASDNSFDRLMGSDK